MIIKYISFLIGIIWSYSIIKTQSVFSKKAGIIFKIFITNVSWFTLIAACYFGYKNFSIIQKLFNQINNFRNYHWCYLSKHWVLFFKKIYKS